MLLETNRASGHAARASEQPAHAARTAQATSSQPTRARTAQAASSYARPSVARRRPRRTGPVDGHTRTAQQTWRQIFFEMAPYAFPNRAEVHEHYSNKSRICSKDPT